METRGMKLWRDPKSNIWHYRFQRAGVRVQRSTGTAVKAEAEAIAMEAYRVARLRARGIEPVPTLAETVQQWLEQHAGMIDTGEISFAHWKSVRDFGCLHLYGLDQVAFDALSTTVIRAAMAKHRVGRSPASVNHWHRILNLLGHWLRRAKVIAELPWDIPMPTLQQEPRPILSERQAAEWIAAVDATAYRHLGKTEFKAVSVAVRLLIGVGLRESELLGARWEFFSWNAELKRWTYLPGRIDDKGKFRTKGKKKKPKPVPGWLITYLQPLWTDMGLVLVDSAGHAFGAGMCRRAITAANTACNTPGITPHRLRATFATWLSRSRPIQEVQAALGHADPRTTMGYLEADLEATGAALDEIGQRAGLG